MQKRGLIIWVAAFVGWMLIGLSFSFNDYLFREVLADYYTASPSLPSMLFWDFAYWPTWAALTPLTFWIARRFPLGRDIRPANLFANISAGLLLTILQRTIYFLIALAAGVQIPFSELYLFLLYNLPTGFMSYGVILLASHVYNDYKRYQEEALRTSRLEAELTQARLQAIQMQLKPHFLFNTLNSISSQLHEDPRAADEMLAQLGEFLRLTLEHSGAQVVTLEEELYFLRCYLDIEKVRREDRLQVQYEIEPQALAAQVPNLILQPIMENAIIHGVGQSLGQVHIVVSARREDDKLSLQISDDGERPPRNGDGYQEGDGIRNTRERLKTAYGSAQSFELKRTPDGWTAAVIEMPFVTAAENLCAATVGR
jgi:sensor histidine kinase YesM